MTLRFILGIGGAFLLLFAGIWGAYWYGQSKQTLPVHIQQLKDREKKQ